METLSIQFGLALLENELSKNEEYPTINVFLDARFERNPVTVGLNVKNATVTGTLKTKTIPQTAALILSGFAWRYNKQGVRCKMDIGTNHVFLNEIINGKTEFDIPIIMHTVRNLEKAKVRLTIHKVDSGNIQVVNRKFDGTLMTKYIKSNINAEAHMKNTISGTDNMRVPYDISESGIELTKNVPLPSDAYVMTQTPKSNDEYWENVLANVMKRDGLHPADFYKLDSEHQARVMAQIVCYAPQYLDYVSDTVDINGTAQGCENFGDSLVTWSGDCEDLATGILMCFNSFVEHKFTSKRLKQIQDIAKQYIPLMSLDVVNGAQVVDENSPKGAHMNVNLVPIHMFRKWMRATPKGKELDAQLDSLYPDKLDTSLPFMVGEGTGMLEPLGEPDPLVGFKARVYGCNSLRRFKKPISRSRTDPGGFLVGSLNGFTDYFYKRGLNIGSLVYATRHPDNSITRGTFYSDMINDGRDVAILMHDPIGHNEMEVIQEAIMYRDPPHDLILSRKVWHNPNKHLDAVVKAIKDLKRVGSNQFVPVYVRPNQIDEAGAKNMIYDMTRQTKVWKIEYSLEMVTDAVWGYEMRIYM